MDLQEMDAVQRIAEMIQDGAPFEDILVFMIENKVQRIVLMDGTVFDPAERILH
jgi:hypothetical protein